MLPVWMTKMTTSEWVNETNSLMNDSDMISDFSFLLSLAQIPQAVTSSCFVNLTSGLFFHVKHIRKTFLGNVDVVTSKKINQNVTEKNPTLHAWMNVHIL